MNQNKALVIDASALIYRAFHATYKQAIYAQEHHLIPVNAIKLFAIMLFNLIKQNDYQYILIALDSKEQTKRASIFADYKKTRKPMDPLLVSQLQYIDELFDLMGLKTIKQAGIEADDFIGSFCQLTTNQQIKTVVYSSDKDLLQLVNQYVDVCLIKNGLQDVVVYNNDNFQSLCNGLSPSQIPDFKGLVGDNSDNLPGIKGIGTKTALNLLYNYHNLENIYTHIDELKNTVKNKVIANYELGCLCKQLATIDCSLLLDYKLDYFKPKDFDVAGLDAFFAKLKINHMANYYK